MPRILIRMNDKKARESVAGFLAGEHQVEAAADFSGPAEGFDLLILDEANLSSHLEMVASLGSGGETGSAPVLLALGKGRGETGWRHLGNSVDDVVALPVDGAELRARTTNLLVRRDALAGTPPRGSGCDVADAALKTTNEYYRAFLEKFRGIAFRCKPDFTFVFVHGAVGEITGFDSREMLNREVSWLSLIHPDDREEYVADIGNIGSCNDITEREYRILRKDGQVRWMHEHIQTLCDESGEPFEFHGAVYDVTERVESENRTRLALAAAHTRTSLTEGLLLSAREVLASSDFTEAARQIFHYCSWMIGSMAGYVFLVDKDGNSRELVVLDAGEPEWSCGGCLPGPVEALRDKARDSGGVVVENSLDAPELSFAGGRLELGRILFAPMAVTDWGAGVIGLANKAEDFTTQDVRLAKIFADLGSVAMTHFSALRKLEKSEQEFRSIVETSNEGIWIVNRECVTSYVNRRMAEMLGYRPDEMVGESCMDFMDDAWRKLAENRLGGGKKKPGEQFDFQFRQKDGSALWTIVNSARIPGKDGEVETTVNMITDITARKRAEEALGESEKRYRTIFDNAHDSIFIIGPDRIFLAVNKVACERLGYSSEELLTMGPQDLDAPEFAARLPEAFGNIIESGEGVVETAHITKDGRCIPMEVSVKVIEYRGEQAFLSIARDISERKKAEAEIRRFADSLEEAQRIAGLGSWKRDLRSGVATWSNQMYRFFGNKEMGRPLTRRELFESIVPEDRDRVGMLYESEPKDPGPYEIEYSVRRMDGEVVTVHVRGDYEFDERGRPVKVFGTMLDVTERKQVEESLREKEKLLTSILSSLKTAIVIINPEDHSIIDANPMAEEILGVKTKDLLGLKCYDLCRSEGSEAGPCERCLAKGGEPVVEETVFVRSDGRTVPVRRCIFSQVYEGEERVVEIFFDISEQRALEMRLNIAQKMESIGQLASGIAHEINTPTQYVATNTQYFKESLEDIFELVRCFAKLRRALDRGEEVAALSAEAAALEERLELPYLMEDLPSALDETLRGIDRISQIVRSVREFAHPGSGEKVLADINEAIANTVVVTKNSWKYVADLETDLDQDLGPVPCIIGEINQAVVNLVVNAAHAIEEVVDGTGAKGRIVVTTRKKGEWAEISIADTGCGIPESIGNRVFDPFFTTKEVGRGTGQGLAIVHTLVHKHGGEISYTSVPGEGATFRILLPLGDKEAG